MKETVLLYNFDDEKRTAAVKRTLILMCVRIRTVEKKDYLRPLKELLGLEEAAGAEAASRQDYDGEGFAEEMLLMAGFTSRRIDALIAGLKKNGAGRVDLKAVLTPTNAGWNSLELYEEIKREHEKMSGNQA